MKASLKSKISLFAAFVLITSALLVSCNGDSLIKAVGTDIDGNIVVDYADGSSEILVPNSSKSITAAIINDYGELILHYSDGTSDNLGKVAANDGTDGIDGKDGKNGTNGTNGANGTDGTNGANGTDGKDGRGISKVEIVDGEIIITYSDGKVDNLGKISDFIGTEPEENDGYIYKTEDVWVCRCSFLNVRKEPDVDSVSIGLLRLGEKIIRLKYNDQWSVILYNGSEAYVSTKYLNTDDGNVIYTDVDQTLNVLSFWYLRNTPDLSDLRDNTVTSAKSGDTLTMTGISKNGDWARFEYEFKENILTLYGYLPDVSYTITDNGSEEDYK